jgi:hypothetical protein
MVPPPGPDPTMMASYRSATGRESRIERHAAVDE